ncbi:hypothetical protein AB1Y20_002412 [Prymnesium parvum]|uniref:Uncharacterized protein n=1 Tax=Prymnesium parvum TaxID=97485 RepID=A0AB34JAT8_PRYPA|mmetsp:Transcript_6840/g.14299  ORF Transcript_6840/g.14299 Transcript_6840/m.14299 type:complete len:110 (-) Transcript_6840:713-1042(-)
MEERAEKQKDESTEESSPNVSTGRMSLKIFNARLVAQRMFCRKEVPIKRFDSADYFLEKELSERTPRSQPSSDALTASETDVHNILGPPPTPSSTRFSRPSDECRTFIT